MNQNSKFPPEVRERAVRMVQDARGEHPSLWATIESIAPKIGCVPPTLHEWVRKHKVETGMRHGTPRQNATVSRSLSARTGNCAAPMRS